MKKSKPISASDLPPHILELNPHVLGQMSKGASVKDLMERCRRLSDIVSGRHVVTEKNPERKLNKTEERFHEYLKTEFKNEPHLIVPQPTRFFRFGNGDTYTPDFIVISDCGISVYEVKGGYRGAGWEQGYDRYFRAKEKFESYELRITFYLVEWDRKNREWKWSL